MVIRGSTAEDTDGVVGLLRQSWRENRTGVAADDGVVKEYVQHPGYWILGYEDEGTLLRAVTLSFRWILLRGGQVGVIEDLIVE